MCIAKYWFVNYWLSFIMNMWKWIPLGKQNVQSHTSIEKREKKELSFSATENLMRRINTILAEKEPETILGDNIHIEWDELITYQLFAVRERRGHPEDFSKLNMNNIGKRHTYVNRSSRSK